MRECVLSSGPRPGDARHRHAARLRHRPRRRDLDRDEDRARARSTPASPAASTRSAIRRSCSAARTSSCCCAPIAARPRGSASSRSSACARGTSSRVMPGVLEPRTGLSMGEHCEQMAQDLEDFARRPGRARAIASHVNAGARLGARLLQRPRGRRLPGPQDRQQRARRQHAREAGQAQAGLRPAQRQGTLTAGNSTPLTDGASAVLLASEEWARARNLPVLAYFSYSKQWAVDFVGGKEGLLMAPAYAVPRMLKDAEPHAAGLRFLRDPRGVRGAGAVHAQGVGIAGVLPGAARASTARSGSIDRAKLNVNGSQRRHRPPVRRHRHAHRRARSPSSSPNRGPRSAA